MLSCDIVENEINKYVVFIQFIFPWQRTQQYAIRLLCLEPTSASSAMLLGTQPVFARISSRLIRQPPLQSGVMLKFRNAYSKHAALVRSQKPASFYTLQMSTQRLLVYILAWTWQPPEQSTWLNLLSLVGWFILIVQFGCAVYCEAVQVGCI